MSKTIVSPPVCSEQEHAIVALLSDESSKKVAAAQHQLKQLFGDAIWVTPPRALHITLMEIICDTDYKDLSRKQHFTKWHEEYNQVTKDAVARFRPFHATFNQLLVSPRAIILKAGDPKQFSEIREVLLSNITLPEGTKLPPDIAHCTIARFNEAIVLDDVIGQTKSIMCSFTEYIQKFKLLKDLGPRDFNPVCIETYDLWK